MVFTQIVSLSCGHHKDLVGIFLKKEATSVIIHVFESPHLLYKYWFNFPASWAFV